MRDHASFDAFYATTRARVLRQLTAMTASPEQAKDAVQEAYERAWQRWARVSRLDDPEGWVRTVAWRVAVSSHRRAVVASRFLPRLWRERTTSVATDEVLDVQQALRRLRPEQRRALVLHHICDRSVEEIAAETGVSVGTVKSRLSRGRAALAKEIGPGYSTGAPVTVEEGRL